MADEQPPVYGELPPGVTVELLMKNPAGRDAEGNELVPDPRWLEWSPVEIVSDPVNCEHVHTMCYECGDSWGIDYYIRFMQDGKAIWLSPDHPDHPDDRKS